MAWPVTGGGEFVRITRPNDSDDPRLIVQKDDGVMVYQSYWESCFKDYAIIVTDGFIDLVDRINQFKLHCDTYRKLSRKEHEKDLCVTEFTALNFWPNWMQKWPSSQRVAEYKDKVWVGIHVRWLAHWYSDHLEETLQQAKKDKAQVHYELRHHRDKKEFLKFHSLTSALRKKYPWGSGVAFEDVDERFRGLDQDGKRNCFKGRAYVIHFSMAYMEPSDTGLFVGGIRI